MRLLPILFLLLSVWIVGGLRSFAQSLAPSIILGRPTANSVTASVLFEQDAEFYIRYGLASGTYSDSTLIVSASAGAPVELDMNQLSPDNRYYYTLLYRSSGAGAFAVTPEYSVHTQRASGASFTFTIEADEHLYDKKGVQSIYSICLRNQAADQPDFMLSLGDIFGDDHEPDSITAYQVDSLHRAYRPFLGSICHSVPFYVCLGNHEGENDYYLGQHPPNNLAVWSTLSRKYYYPNPYPNAFYSGNMNSEPFGIDEPENYYAWTWGDALFVVLDVYRDQCDTSPKPQNWNWSLGFPQYSWLKNTLENSNALHKFVFAHHIRGQGRGGINEARYFEWGGYNADSTTYAFPTRRPGWDKPIHQLFVDNGVSIFFQGHDHLFAHEQLDGVTYQEVPMPSDSTYMIGMLANADAYTADTIMGTGHLRVVVSPTCVGVDFVRAWLPADTVGGVHRNGEVAFHYEVGSCLSAVDDQMQELALRPFPQPADQYLFLKAPESLTEPFTATLLDLFGRVVATTNLPVIDVGGLPNGIYMLRMDAGHRTFTSMALIVH